MQTRAMYGNIKTVSNHMNTHLLWWHSTKDGPGTAATAVHIRKDAHTELEFWSNNIHRVNGHPFKRDSLYQFLDIMIDLYTDASGRSWGAVPYLPSASNSALLLMASRALPPQMTIHWQAVQPAFHHRIHVRGIFSQP